MMGTLRVDGMESVVEVICQHIVMERQGLALKATLFPNYVYEPLPAFRLQFCRECAYALRADVNSWADLTER